MKMSERKNRLQQLSAKQKAVQSLNMNCLQTPVTSYVKKKSKIETKTGYFTNWILFGLTLS